MNNERFTRILLPFTSIIMGRLVWLNMFIPVHVIIRSYTHRYSLEIHCSPVTPLYSENQLGCAFKTSNVIYFEKLLALLGLQVRLKCNANLMGDHHTTFSYHKSYYWLEIKYCTRLYSKKTWSDISQMFDRDSHSLRRAILDSRIGL